MIERIYFGAYKTVHFMEIGFRETFRTASILRQGKLLRLQRALPEGGGDDDLEFTAISGSLNPEVEPRHPEVEPRYPEAKPLSKKKETVH